LAKKWQHNPRVEGSTPTLTTRTNVCNQKNDLLLQVIVIGAILSYQVKNIKYIFGM
jgi:hypothetical protein